MTSKDFDAYLRLENSKKEQLAQDDDSGGNLNARIIFTTREDGVYRVIATTYRPDATGKFQLRIETPPANKPIEAPRRIDRDGPLKKPLSRDIDKLLNQFANTGVIEGAI
jgi:hypothetical protein